MRHPVERPRPPAPVVSALSRGADGATARHAADGPALEHASSPIDAASSRRAAHTAAASLGLSLDSRAPRGRTTGAATAALPRAHPALRGHTPLGSCGSCRPGRASARNAGADSTTTRARAHHAVRQRAGSRDCGAGVRGSLRAVGRQPQHLAELPGGRCRRMVGGSCQCRGSRGGDRYLRDAGAVAGGSPRRRVHALRPAGVAF